MHLLGGVQSFFIPPIGSWYSSGNDWLAWLKRNSAVLYAKSTEVDKIGRSAADPQKGRYGDFLVDETISDSAITTQSISSSQGTATFSIAAGTITCTGAGTAWSITLSDGTVYLYPEKIGTDALWWKAAGGTATASVADVDAHCGESVQYGYSVNELGYSQRVAGYGGTFSFDGGESATETFKLKTTGGERWLLNGELVESDVDYAINTAGVDTFDIAVQNVAIDNITFYNTNISGDIGNLADWRPTGHVYFYSTSIFGNIGDLADWRPTGNIYFNNTNISGDIGNLAGWRPTGHVYFYNTNISGDIGDLADWRPTGNIFFSITDISTCSIVPLLFPDSVDIHFDGCAIDQTGINNILVAVENAGTSSGTLDLSGGTNAVPSSTGLTAKTALEGRGWTVTVNS